MKKEAIPGSGREEGAKTRDSWKRVGQWRGVVGGYRIQKKEVTGTMMKR